MKKIITLSLLCSPFLLLAQGYQVHVQGQKQQAMANAGTGLAQDAATVFYNPGAMSFLKDNSVSVGGNAAIVKSVFRDSLTQQIFNSETPISTPITFYAVYGADSSKSKVLQNLNFGLGVYTPFGGASKYPAEWVGRFVLNSLNLKFINIQPTVNYKISEKLGIGAGFVYSMGSIEVNKDIYLTDTLGNFGNANIKANLTGFGVNAGIMYRPTPSFSIGLSYRSQIKTKSSGGTAEFKVPANLTDSVPSGGASLTFPQPSVISLGLGYTVDEKLSFAFDVRYIGFKVFDTLRVDFEKNTTNHTDIADPRKYTNTYSFHLGAQYMATEKFATRVGLRYALTPIDYGYNSAEGGDANHFVMCVGVGYKFNKHFGVDASYTFQRMYRNGSNSYYNLIGTYKTYASIAGLSLSYHF